MGGQLTALLIVSNLGLLHHFKLQDSRQQICETGAQQPDSISSMPFFCNGNYLIYSAASSSERWNHCFEIASG